VSPYTNVFAAGDSAVLKSGGTVLRKAVNFALGSGVTAGRNIAADIRSQPLERFRPVDLGWVIPFCDMGVGLLFQRVPVRGRVPLALHYAMCGLRHFNTRNRLVFWGRALRALCRVG
jgi:NADH dehydrogenase FAD-containing subunit